MSKIYQAISAILADVEAIGKNRNNSQQNYKFRGIDDVYNAIHPLLAKHKVFPTCEILSREVTERTTQKGGALFYVNMKAKYTLWAEDGSNVTTEAWGEAMDSGDKASNKAMSAAYKYALFQLLCIPTEAVDSDSESFEEDVAPAKRNADKIAAQHGMTTADKLPPKPSAIETARSKFPQIDSFDKARKFAEWVEHKVESKELTTGQASDICSSLAAKLPEWCDELTDYEHADAMILDMLKRMRIDDPTCTALRIALSDAKDSKLGAAA